MEQVTAKAQLIDRLLRDRELGDMGEGLYDVIANLRSAGVSRAAVARLLYRWTGVRVSHEWVRRHEQPERVAA